MYANLDTVSNINFLAGTDLQDIVWASADLNHFATGGGNDFSMVDGMNTSRPVLEMTRLRWVQVGLLHMNAGKR